MLGPFINASVILVCALLGAFFVRGIPARFDYIVKKAIALSIIFVGLRGALENQHTLLLILSLVLGAVIGELINIDKWMNKLGELCEKKFARSLKGGNSSNGNFTKGFVEASILFCSGSMAIVGSMQSGLSGNHEMLFAKSVLDGTISIVLASAMGIGVAFSAIPVIVYEGAITVFSMFVSSALSTDAIREMSAVGSLVIAAIGFNFLEVKEIKVANLIPAIFIPLVYFLVR
ncbi:MAG: DUF554 domain-containing protein [Termitinemataceae bacterium]|nr:MAG: DUF554 domain-containing protein [Termitinemataceae bacterium]